MRTAPRPVARFVNASTIGGPGGMTGSIELHAHEEMPYTNDMLTWMHQALSSKKKVIYRFFTLDGNADDNLKR